MTTNVKQLGEFALIEKFKSILKRSLPEAVIGIGDDCSVVQFDEQHFLITTTDMLLEGVHWLSTKISAFELGWKSIAVNLSDIAAMGGIPQFVHVSLAIPKHIDVNYLLQFYQGMEQICQLHQVHIIGGDTTRSQNDFVINISVQGKVEKNRIKLRNQAQVGDVICVTGNIGDSGIGLEYVLHHADRDEYFLERHHKPVPHVEQGRFLSQFPQVHAMMDVSDGIGMDIRRIVEQSHVGVAIEADKIPYSKYAAEFFAHNAQIHKGQFLLNSGEEYCLLCTIDPQHFADIKTAFDQQFATPLIVIGEVVKECQTIFSFDGTKLEQPCGFDHFS